MRLSDALQEGRYWVNAHNGDEYIKSNVQFFKDWVKCQTQCSQIIKEMNTSSKYLLRGTDDTHDSFLQPVRKGKRKPRDSRVEIDQFFEDYRKKWFPQVPNRQKAVFVMLEKVNTRAQLFSDNAKGYGSEMVLVLPKNGSTYFQSGTTQDFYESATYHQIWKLTSMQGELGIHDVSTPMTIQKYKKTSFSISDDVVEANYKEYLKEFKRVEKEMGETEKILDKYFTSGKVNVGDMKTGKSEVMIEHKGYWAFNRMVIQYYCTLAKVKPADMFSKEGLIEIKKSLSSKK